MITDSQRRVLLFLKDYLIKNGYSPKLPEIAKGIGINSTGVVHRYIRELEQLGYLKVEARRHRGITLLMEENNGKQDTEGNVSAIPLLGKIAAGRPIEAIANQDSLNINTAFHARNIFALKVQGDSMINAGILDGDYVICESKSIASNNQIVVALIEREEATLKRFKNNENGTITLFPENDCYKPMTYESDRIEVQGVVVGQLRILYTQNNCILG